MACLHLLLVLLNFGKSAAAILSGPALLSKSLSKTGGRPLIVHIWDPNPAALESFAIDDVSEACRTAGAAAILCGLDLLAVVTEEQDSARGAFPGSLPVVTEVALADLLGEDGPQELCGSAKKLGACGIGIRYYTTEWKDPSALEETLQRTVAAAEEAGLGSLLLPEFGVNGEEGVAGGGALAARVGAAAGLSKEPETGGDGEKHAIGCWDGDPTTLQTLRDEGFRGLLLKNACCGDVAWGSKIKQPSLAAQALARLVKASQSKGNSAVWGGAGVTGASGGGQSTAAYASRDKVEVPFELGAQMGTPRWAEKS